MNANFAQYTEAIRQRLLAMETQLSNVRSDIVLSNAGNNEVLREKLKMADLNLRQTKKNIRVANSENPKTTKVHERKGVAVAQGWKTESKKMKLDNHAFRAEDNSEEALSHAEVRVAEMVLVIYQAIGARRSAENMRADLQNSTHEKGRLSKKTVLQESGKQ
jgi:hypothetical protein